MKQELIAFINAEHNKEMNDRNLPFLVAGYANGYVAIPPGHPCYRKRYTDESLDGIQVHGGITFSEPVCYEDESFMSKRRINPEYIGTRSCLFDNAEYVTDTKDVPDDWWILGFDTCHYQDNLHRWTREDVIEETQRLKKQLEDLWRD